jgi:hypothetical protein
MNVRGAGSRPIKGKSPGGDRVERQGGVDNCLTIWLNCQIAQTAREGRVVAPSDHRLDIRAGRRPVFAQVRLRGPLMRNCPCGFLADRLVPLLPSSLVAPSKCTRCTNRAMADMRAVRHVIVMACAQ